jgi:hypothetical protein
MVERVEGMQAATAAHPALARKQLFRRQPENGLAAWATGQHRGWTQRGGKKTLNSKSSFTRYEYPAYRLRVLFWRDTGKIMVDSDLPA